MTTAIDPELDLEALEAMPAERLLEWAVESYDRRAAIITSFQNTGCVMIDMAARVAPSLRVLTVDTLRLHDETYVLIEAIEARYGIGVERFQPEPQRVSEMVAEHGEFLFFDGRPQQEHCCAVRKVEPNQRALGTVDAWITGLRRDQSPGRRRLPRAEFVANGDRRLLKLCPLIDWGEDQVWAYIRDNDVPYNTLYDSGYTSIGCVICTTPTLPHEERRAGRWRWFNHMEDHHKECGIHLHGSGI